MLPRDCKDPMEEDIGRSGVAGTDMRPRYDIQRQPVHSHLSKELNRQAHEAFERETRLSDTRLFARDSNVVTVRRATSFGLLSLG